MNANFRGKGRPPPTIFGIRKVDSLSYRTVKKIVERFNRLSRVHQRHRQTTDRQTTDGRPIAYSERNVVRSLISGGWSVNSIKARSIAPLSDFGICLETSA